MYLLQQQGDGFLQYLIFGIDEIGVYPGVQQILYDIAEAGHGVLDFLLIPKAYVFEFDFLFHLAQLLQGIGGGVLVHLVYELVKLAPLQVLVQGNCFRQPFQQVEIPPLQIKVLFFKLHLEKCLVVAEGVASEGNNGLGEYRHPAADGGPGDRSADQETVVGFFQFEI